MPSFLSLPNELILEISDNLLPHDIAALHQTSRRLNSLLENALLTELFRSRSFTRGRRLLYQLSAQPDLKSVEHLIKRGILDFTDPETLLHGAVRFGSVHVLKTLLHFGLEADTKDAKGRTPLSLAAKHGRANFAKVLVAREDVDVNSRDAKFMTPLLIAARRGWKVIVEILVQSGKADLQNISDRMGRNCLHLAALRGRVPMVRFLLRFMDPNEEDRCGRTALHSAVIIKDFPVVECLLEDERVDANPRDHKRNTALHDAVDSDRLDIVKILLSHPRVEINEVDNDGQTPLHLAVIWGNVGIIRLFTSSPEADVNLPVKSGIRNTPLHIAIDGGDLEIVRLFLEHSEIDINLANGQGKSPLDFALEKELDLSSLLSPSRTWSHVGPDRWGHSILRTLLRGWGGRGFGLD